MTFSRVVQPRSKKRWFRRILVWSVVLLVLGVVVMATLNIWMVQAESDRIYKHIELLPARPVALVLGAGPGSLYLERRLDAAAKLYREGKVRLLIVSGSGVSPDDPTGSETALMKQGLVTRGIPTAAIIRDDAGWRTLDSMARAKMVFGLNSVIIVSQDFHLPRALFLAKHWGLDAVGYAADDPGGDFYHNDVREWVARVLAVGDVICNRQPRNPGPPQQINLPALPVSRALPTP